MNASNSSTSGPRSTSALMRSTAWLVFKPARVNSRNAVCSASIASREKSRRSRPTRFAPNTADFALADYARKRHHVLRDYAVSADE